MAPELLNTIEANELRDMAEKIQAYQLAQKFSDNELYRKLPAIGSTKTYKKILNNDLKEVDLEKQLANYRSACAFIESVGESIEEEEHILRTLSGPIELHRAFLEASTQSSIARFILVQGDTGMGKTFALLSLADKYGGRCFILEGSEAWNDRPNAMLAEFLRALGVKEQPESAADKQTIVIERLRAARRCALLDEGHHLGPQCLNTIKTLINQTPGEFVIGAMETLWNRLERASYQEVRQLTGNRLAERIKLTLDKADVEKYVADRIHGLDKDEVKKAVELLMADAPRNANLAFVRNVCRRANRAAEKDAVTYEIFSVAEKEEKARR